MTLPDFLSQDDQGYIHVTGHRVGLGDIVFFYRQGDSPEMLHARFPTVALPLFYKVIAYYLENEPAVDEYCARQAEEIARQRAEARRGPTADELRERREARRVARADRYVGNAHAGWSIKRSTFCGRMPIDRVMSTSGRMASIRHGFPAPPIRRRVLVAGR